MVQAGSIERLIQPAYIVCSKCVQIYEAFDIHRKAIWRVVQPTIWGGRWAVKFPRLPEDKATSGHDYLPDKAARNMLA